MNNLTDYNILFEEVFYRPLILISEKYREVKDHIEFIFDTIAGPLSSIKDYGQWDYVYSRNDEYFNNINNIKDLQYWFKDYIDTCYNYLNKIESETPYEVSDRYEIEEKMESVRSLVQSAEKIQLQHETKS